MLAVSFDGLRSAAVRRLGAAGAPALHAMIRRGAGTLNARTLRELTITLPNHAGMITGRPVSAERGGHGVTSHDDPGGTVHGLAGERVSSVFTVAARRGGRPAMFVSKSKFALFARSWPCALARYTSRERIAGLTDVVRRDLRKKDRAFRFVHYNAPDVAGHRHGFGSRQYLAAVRRSDHQLGRLLRLLRASGRRSTTTVLVTSDHGGSGSGHSEPADRRHHTVPFLAWGAGVARGGDLYRLNPELREPGRRRTGYAGRQPVRNADLANLALDLLGARHVPGSRFNADQTLDVAP